MSGSLNKVTLIGRLGADPQVRTQSDGSSMVVLSLATSENWRDRTTNERRERTEWHRVVIFNPRLVEIVSKYAKKGQCVYVEGQSQTRKWTDPATQQSRTMQEVVLRPNSPNATFIFLDNRDPTGERAPSEDLPYGAPEPHPEYDSPSSSQNNTSSSTTLDDDEIPF